MHLDDEAHMRTAFELAAKGYGESGCPIGGVLVDNATGKILGKGTTRWCRTATRSSMARWRRCA
jgi:tRNA(Arg) A34 adenosine deaminase TadA